MTVVVLNRGLWQSSVGGGALPHGKFSFCYLFWRCYLLVFCSMPSWPSRWGYPAEARRKRPLLHKVAPVGQRPPTRRRMSMRGVCVSLRPPTFATRLITTPSVHDLKPPKEPLGPRSPGGRLFSFFIVQRRKKPKLTPAESSFYFVVDWDLMKISAVFNHVWKPGVSTSCPCLVSLWTCTFCWFESSLRLLYVY